MITIQQNIRIFIIIIIQHYYSVVSQQQHYQQFETNKFDSKILQEFENTQLNEEDCKIDQYFNQNLNLCQDCDSICFMCKSQFSCSSCTLPKKLFNNTCLDKCPHQYYEQSNECMICDQSCSGCTQYGNEHCIQCNFPRYKLIDHKCSLYCQDIQNCQSCPENQYIIFFQSQQIAEQNNSKQCEICINGYFLTDEMQCRQAFQYFIYPSLLTIEIQLNHIYSQFLENVQVIAKYENDFEHFNPNLYNVTYRNVFYPNMTKNQQNQQNQYETYTTYNALLFVNFASIKNIILKNTQRNIILYLSTFGNCHPQCFQNQELIFNFEEIYQNKQCTQQIVMIPKIRLTNSINILDLYFNVDVGEIGKLMNAYVNIDVIGIQKSDFDYIIVQKNLQAFQIELKYYINIIGIPIIRASFNFPTSLSQFCNMQIYEDEQYLTVGKQIQYVLTTQEEKQIEQSKKIRSILNIAVIILIVIDYFINTNLSIALRGVLLVNTYYSFKFLDLQYPPNFLLMLNSQVDVENRLQIPKLQLQQEDSNLVMDIYSKIGIFYYYYNNLIEIIAFLLIFVFFGYVCKISKNQVEKFAKNQHKICFNFFMWIHNTLVWGFSILFLVSKYQKIAAINFIILKHITFSSFIGKINYILNIISLPLLIIIPRKLGVSQSVYEDYGIEKPTHKIKPLIEDQKKINSFNKQIGNIKKYQRQSLESAKNLIKRQFTKLKQRRKIQEKKRSSHLFFKEDAIKQWRKEKKLKIISTDSQDVMITKENAHQNGSQHLISFFSENEMNESESQYQQGIIDLQMAQGQQASVTDEKKFLKNLKDYESGVRDEKNQKDQNKDQQILNLRINQIKNENFVLRTNQRQQSQTNQQEDGSSKNFIMRTPMHSQTGIQKQQTSSKIWKRNKQSQFSDMIDLIQQKQEKSNSQSQSINISNAITPQNNIMGNQILDQKIQQNSQSQFQSETHIKTPPSNKLSFQNTRRNSIIQKNSNQTNNGQEQNQNQDQTQQKQSLRRNAFVKTQITNALSFQKSLLERQDSINSSVIQPHIKQTNENTEQSQLEQQKNIKTSKILRSNKKRLTEAEIEFYTNKIHQKNQQKNDIENNDQNKNQNNTQKKFQFKSAKSINFNQEDLNSSNKNNINISLPSSNFFLQKKQKQEQQKIIKEEQEDDEENKQKLQQGSKIFRSNQRVNTNVVESNLRSIVTKDLNQQKLDNINQNAIKLFQNKTPQSNATKSLRERLQINGLTDIQANFSSSILKKNQKNNDMSHFEDESNKSNRNSNQKAQSSRFRQKKIQGLLNELNFDNSGKNLSNKSYQNQSQQSLISHIPSENDQIINENIIEQPKVQIECIQELQPQLLVKQDENDLNEKQIAINNDNSNSNLKELKLNQYCIDIQQQQNKNPKQKNINFQQRLLKQLKKLPTFALQHKKALKYGCFCFYGVAKYLYMTFNCLGPLLKFPKKFVNMVLSNIGNYILIDLTRHLFVQAFIIFLYHIPIVSLACCFLTHSLFIVYLKKYSPFKTKSEIIYTAIFEFCIISQIIMLIFLAIKQSSKNKSQIDKNMALGWFLLLCIIILYLIMILQNIPTIINVYKKLKNNLCRSKVLPINDKNFCNKQNIK